MCIRDSYTPLSTALDYLSDESDRTIESIVVMECSYGGWKSESSGVSILPTIEYPTHSNFPLSVLIYPSENLSIVPVFDSLRFSESQVASLASHLVRLIEIMCAGSVVNIGELVSAWRTSVFAEQSRNYHGVAMTRGPNTRVDRWLDAICQTNSHKVALVDSEKSITYGELYNKSNQIANMLLDTCAPDARYIGVYCERSVDQIVAFYGVIKAGMAYIPLDPSYPDERNRMICHDSVSYTHLTLPTIYSV